MIPIAKPLIGQEEINGVVSVLQSGTLAEGPRVKEFEEAFASYTGVRHAIAVNSGTAALHVALLAKGIGKDDEVIVPPFTFIATANSVLFAGAKPVFADVDPETFNIDPEKIKEKITKRTRAIIPVDLYGQAAAMETIMDLARDHGLAVIEDACQAHGASVNGRKCGSFDVGCFSFYPTKNMTTSEGGMITSDDREFDARARMIRSHGSRVRYYHEMLGFNLRMTDISAAIGLAQLRKIEEYNEKRIANASRLSQQLQGIKGIVTPVVRPGHRHVFHQYTLRITPDFHLSRDEVVRRLGDAGIGSAVYYPVPVHRQQLYQEMGYTDSFPVSEMLSGQVISLPVHPSVTPEEIDFIAATIRRL
ncbi:DegT/DnrJ/EryC1/StrS family aminotransferase [Methanocella arvoryzae]|uniref:Aminotransferase (DegT family) n=1 Tax=Methanocella arvoryzae (strain DSM 22066 / NBRC 105507 / MRE50) TaxID=351160 RepID=Q0W3F3_METAR|nr:DegT/DnrJ/EryC1/StrS family aminotransferase [Methanocella arvoryzae]CAJ37090.1 aminotransferase (DegT family) [Methanocella arvoryzae MRE50]